MKKSSLMKRKKKLKSGMDFECFLVVNALWKWFLKCDLEVFVRYHSSILYLINDTA